MSDPRGRLRQRGGVEARPYPKGALLVDMGSGRCFRLNRVGAEIWTMLAAPLAVDDICRGVAERYGKTVAEIAGEIGDLVGHLERENLIIADELGPSPGTP